VKGGDAAPARGLAFKRLEAFVLASGGEIRTQGFARAVEAVGEEVAGGKRRLAHVVSRVLSSEIGRPDILGFVPDAFEIVKPERRLTLFEAEDTSYIGPQKWNRMDYLQAVAHELGWTVTLVLIDRYGFSREMSSEEIELAAVMAGIADAQKRDAGTEAAQ